MDKHCRSCGAELTEPGDKHCPNCGAEIATAKEPDAPAKPESDQAPSSQTVDASNKAPALQPIIPPSKQKSESSRRTPLLIAGVIAAVVIVVAIVVIGGSGSDDSSASSNSSSLPSADELPANTVAVVTQVRGSARTISTADLKRAIGQASAQKELKSAPTPGQPKYKETEEAGLGEILDETWIQGQAAEMGVSTTDKEVADEFAKLKRENFKTEKLYQEFLKTSLLTEADALDRVELQLLSTKIQEQISNDAKGGKDAREKAFSDFVDAYQKRWRSRTVCAEAYVIERCSNGPEPSSTTP